MLFLILFYLAVLIIINFHAGVFIQSIVLFTVSATIGILKFITFGLYADEQYYFQSAISTVSSFKDFDLISILIPTTKSSLSTLSSAIFEISIINPLLIITLNAMLLGLVPTILVFACKNFALTTKPSLIGWITVFAFPLTLFTPWFNREALSFFLLSLVVLSSSLIVNKKIKSGIILYSAVAPIIFFTRGQLLLVLIISFSILILYFVYMQNQLAILKTRKKKTWLVLPFILAVVGLFYFFSNYRSLLASNTVQNVIVGNSGKGNSTIPQFTSPDFNLEPLGFTYNLIRSIFGPLPWEWTNTKFFLIGLDGSFYALIGMLLAILYIKNIETRYLFVLLLVPLIPVWLYSSLTLANYGLNMRIRAHFLPFLIPLLAVSLSSFLSSKFRRQDIFIEKL